MKGLISFDNISQKGRIIHFLSSNGLNVAKWDEVESLLQNILS